MPTLHRELTKNTLTSGNLKDVEKNTPNFELLTELETTPNFLSVNIQDEKSVDGDNNIVPLNKIPPMPGHLGDPILCRLQPFNICYRLDKDGTMHPLGDRRLVRLIRMYI